MKAQEKALKVGDLAHQKKAKDIVILEMKELTTVTDYFVICSGTSFVHLEAIADGIIEGLTKDRIKPLGVEGASFSNWILMDYGDVVIHIFRKEARVFYRLENLWGDAKKIRRKKGRERTKEVKLDTG